MLIGVFLLITSWSMVYETMMKNNAEDFYDNAVIRFPRFALLQYIKYSAMQNGWQCSWGGHCFYATHAIAAIPRAA